MDFHLGPEVFRRLTDDRDVDDVEDLVERVAIIYDIVMPPPKE